MTDLESLTLLYHGYMDVESHRSLPSYFIIYCHKTTTVIGSLMVGLVEGYNKCLFGRVCGIESTTFSK